MRRRLCSEGEGRVGAFDRLGRQVLTTAATPVGIGTDYDPALNDGMAFATIIRTVWVTVVR